MDLIEAVKYQTLVLLLLKGAGGIAAPSAVYLAARSVTDRRERMRLDHMQE